MKKLLFALIILFCGIPALFSQTINTIAGNGIIGYSGDGGPATAAELSVPDDMIFDSHGNLLFSDVGNNRIRIISPSGIITTIFGNGVAGYSGDGGLATAAELDSCVGITFDSIGNIYIADQMNNRVRKVTMSTGIISTVAGNGIAGYSGDGGPATAAKLNYLLGVYSDATGNLYISDCSNQRIREVIASSGIITTVAGNGVRGYSGDGGPATAAEIAKPHRTILDASGNLIISDFLNNRVRKIDHSTGIITTIAGTGIAGFGGDGGPATAANLYQPIGLFLDTLGNLYIGDTYNNCIREVNASTTIIITIAGNNVMGFSGDGGPATAAELNIPHKAFINSSGNIYFTDTRNLRIREISNSSIIGINKLKNNNSNLTIFPDPTNQTLFIKIDKDFTSGSITITDITGKSILYQHINKQQNTLQMDVSTFANGMYFIQILNEGERYIGKFIKE